MISKLYAEFLEEVKRLGCKLSCEQQIALEEAHKVFPIELRGERKWMRQERLSTFS